RSEDRLERAMQPKLDEWELKTGAQVLEEVDPRDRQLRAAIHVNRVEQLAEREMVEGLEIELGCAALLTQGDEVVLAARGYAVDHDVRDAARHLGESGLGIRSGALRLLHACRELLHLRHKGGLLVF